MDDDRTPPGLPPAPLGPEPSPIDDTPTDPFARRQDRPCKCATRRDLVFAVLAILLALAWLHA